MIDYKKLYELKKAEKLLKKHKILNKVQEDTLNIEAKKYELDKNKR